MLSAFVKSRPMGNFDYDNNKLVLTDFINNSIDSLSNPIPLLGREFSAPLTARIFA